MKYLAAIFANLDESPLGTRSRQADELRGRPILTHTVDRVLQAERPDEVCVICPSAQADRVQNLLGTSKVKLVAVQTDVTPYRQLVQAARRWALDGWRGGIGGTCHFDEYANPAILAQTMHQLGAEAVIAFPGEAPLLDPVVVDAMLEHYSANAEYMRMTFTQAPPGLTGVIFSMELLQKLTDAKHPPGLSLAYHPDKPAPDLIYKDCCYTSSDIVRHTQGRLTIDTDRSAAAVNAFLDTTPDWQDISNERVCRWLADWQRTHVDSLPVEVEIEMTTEDQHAATRVRPQGNAVPRRGPIDLDVVDRITAQLGTRDDSLVVLGGFGEPLLHPQFADVCRMCHQNGIFGLAVHTNAIDLTPDVDRVLFANGVGILIVKIDACSPEGYQQVHGLDAYGTVVSNIRRLNAAKQQHETPMPLIVPELVKSTETTEDMEEFYDAWLREMGGTVITGYSHCGGQLPDRSVMDMSPPVRSACRRLASRCLVLADGTVTSCDQDFAGRQIIGDLSKNSLQEIWQGPAFTALRADQSTNRYDNHPVCTPCSEWHRP